MSKAVKAMITAELRERYAGMDSACVVDLTGMKVQEQEQLRRNLREKSARVEVIKNALAKRAFQDSPLNPLGEVLEGPCALVTSSESSVDIAKVLVAAAAEFTELKLKQAILEGDPSLFTVEELSKMKGRVEIFGDIAGLLVAPMRAVAGCLKAPPSKIAGCLKAMVDKAS